MKKNITEKIWRLHKYKYHQMLKFGLQYGLVRPYDDELIKKLRAIYYGGIPASITLLSNAMSNGYCYDRALFLARAFLDVQDDVQLVYATIDSLKLNPLYANRSSLTADHCLVERTTGDGRHFIYDTSVGFVFDKRYFWLMENPRVRKINDKDAIRKFVEEDEERHNEDIENDKYIAPFVISQIQKTFEEPGEWYTIKGVELLQREIEYYKELINYDEVVAEFEDAIKRLEDSKRV